MSDLDPELLAKKRRSSARVAARLEAELACKNLRIVKKVQVARNEIVDAVLRAAGVDQALIHQRHERATKAARRSIEKLMPQLLDIVEVRAQEQKEAIGLIKAGARFKPLKPAISPSPSTILSFLDIADRIAMVDELSLQPPPLQPIAYASSIAPGANLIRTVIPADLNYSGPIFEWLFSWTVPADGMLTPACFVLTNGFQPYSTQYVCDGCDVTAYCWVNFELLTQPLTSPVSLGLQFIEGMSKSFDIHHSGVTQWGNNRYIESPISVPVTGGQQIVLSIELGFTCFEQNMASWIDFNSGSGNLNVPLVTLSLETE